jgi:signal transduction histidine kinase
VSEHEPAVHSSTALAEQIARALPTRVPLLVLRIPTAARALEPQAAGVFACAAQRAIREGDRLAHDAGSDWFAIAMFAPSRNGTGSLSLDARAALERVAASMSLAAGARMDTGWWRIESIRDLEPMERTVERALERGARERERFEFLATVGHELRTPLTSIRGYLETVLDEKLDAPTTRRFLMVARNEALRLGRLVDGILDFSPLDISPSLEPGTTDLAAAIEAASDALAPIASEAGIDVRIAPCDYAPARIAQDACMHVLLNVIENAIKYGRRSGHVVVSLEEQDPYLSILVDDDGPGIDASECERIFACRARGSQSRGRRGSGLGLAIVRTIVERAAGNVAVSASPLGGARFVIRLPLAKAELRVNAS